MECVIEVDRVGAVHLGALLGHGGQAKVMECSLETPSVATVGKFYQELSWKGELNQTASHEFEMLQAAASPYVVKAYALQQVPHTAVLEKMVGGFRQVAKEAKTRTMEDRRVRTRDTDHTDLAADLMCPLQVSVLFMELCDISLQQIISQKFREAEAAFVCCSVLKALNHLHRHRILHRDVKPANILLADAGTRVVLSDFGLAAYLPTSSDTLRGPFCGTRGYTAPECSEADSLFSHEADVFALGVVLYFLLFRTYPFRSWDQCLLLGESPWSFVLEPCGRAVVYLPGCGRFASVIKQQSGQHSGPPCHSHHLDLSKSCKSWLILPTGCPCRRPLGVQLPTHPALPRSRSPASPQCSASPRVRVVSGGRTYLQIGEADEAGRCIR
ncbi:unnamed protein product [Durusdinium trenchii]|uniref:Protein kinase domain-containing protein n=1 Tax=Durusdinium trenchii TaxID=1381693 RepID=A0ABP0LN75_9DINO